MISTRTGELRNNRISGDYSIVENGQYTEKSLADLSRLAFPQTPVKDYQLTLMWKTLKEQNNKYLDFDR